MKTVRRLIYGEVLAAVAFMLLAFVTYYNLLSAGSDWIARERVGALSFMLALHGGVALGALLWMAHREHPWTLRLRRRAESPA